jgi:hypothetical protein
LLILALLLFSFTHVAHDPELSNTVLMEQADGTWMLQVRTALAALEY